MTRKLDLEQPVRRHATPPAPQPDGVQAIHADAARSARSEGARSLRPAAGRALRPAADRALRPDPAAALRPAADRALRPGSAQALHAELLAVRRDHRAAEHRLAHLLARLAAGRHHLELGYASVLHYADAVLGLEVRQARALLALGRSLPGLPVLDQALADGELGWTKARELLRVITPETEARWVDVARDCTNRALERMVSGSVRGAEPPDGEPKGQPRQRLVFTVDSVEAEVIERCLALIRSQVDLNRDELDRGALLAMLARRTLYDIEHDEVPSDEPYRVVIEHCPSCRRTEGVDCELRDTIIAEAACDHDVVDMRPGPNRGKRSRNIPKRVRRAVRLRDRHRCGVPGCRNSIWLHLHHLQPYAEGGAHHERNLVSVCSAHHRAIHDGWLAVTRDGSGSIVVEHADGRRLVGGAVGESASRLDPRGSPGVAVARGAAGRRGGARPDEIGRVEAARRLRRPEASAACDPRLDGGESPSAVPPPAVRRE